MKFQIESLSRRRFTRFLATMAICGSLWGAGSSCFSGDPLLGVVQNNPPVNESLALKAENGPWLILAKSFEGPNARTEAEQLATELRRDFGLQAYCHSKRLDFTELQLGAGFDENGRPRRMKYRDQKIVDGYAVLVGDFDSIDGPAVTDTLKKIKRITPRALSATNAEPYDPLYDSVSVNSYRKYLQKIVGRDKDKEKEKEAAQVQGPMHKIAFVTRNPMLPAEFYKAPELDKFVKGLNEHKGFSDFNLIDCPGKFTVRVVVFRGEDQTVSWGRGDSQNADDKLPQLDIAAERAALTVRALRRAGYEAYQFHDRTQSYVTVGSFNELGKVDQANRFVYDRGIQEIVARFGSTNKINRTQYGTSAAPTLLLDLVDQKTMIPELTQAKPKDLPAMLAKFSVAFDLKPAPMAVPRMTVYSGSLLGKDRR